MRKLQLNFYFLSSSYGFCSKWSVDMFDLWEYIEMSHVSCMAIQYLGWPIHMIVIIKGLLCKSAIITIFHIVPIYLSGSFGCSQRALQVVQVSPEAAALGLQPVSVEGQLGWAGLLLLQTVRQVQQLVLQLTPGLLQLDTMMHRPLGALLFLEVSKHRDLLLTIWRPRACAVFFRIHLCVSKHVVLVALLLPSKLKLIVAVSVLLLV